MAEAMRSVAEEMRGAFFHLRETRPADHIYILLDDGHPVARDDPLHASQLAARPVKRDLTPLPPAPGTHDEWPPQLLRYYEAGENGYVDEELLELSLVGAMERRASVNGSYVAAWIGSALEPKQLAEALTARSEIVDVLAVRRRAVAMHEPHRLALLIDDPRAQAFLQMFLEQIDLWMFVDAAGSLRRLPASAARGETGGRRSRTLPAATQAALSRVPLARDALVAVVKAGVEMPECAEATIDRLLQHAGQNGLTHAGDVIFFVLNGLTLAERWHEHPLARQCIERSRDEGAPLAGLFTELSDEQLDEIGAHGNAR